MILSQDLYGQLASLQTVADNSVETVNGKTMEWSQDSVMVSRPYDHPENKMVFLWSVDHSYLRSEDHLSTMVSR